MKVFHNPQNKQVNVLDERFYTKDDITFYPSVTTVLDVYPKGYGFAQWLKDLGHNADEVVRRAGEQGSKIHSGIDLFHKGHELRWLDPEGKSLYSLEEWQMICRFMEFWNKYQPEVIACEISFVNDTYKTGGTIDLVCKIMNQIWIVDYKSSNAIHTTHELQLAAYATCWNDENPNYKVDRTGILWLKAATRGEDKTGKKIQGAGWQLKEFDRKYPDAFKLFTHTRAIWDEENPDYKPKNLIYPDRFIKDESLELLNGTIV